MIVTRAPLRVALGGGGTDLPSYYEKWGGFTISAAINRYVYIALNRPPHSIGYHLRYSKSESVSESCDIEHPIFRETLAKTPPGVEIAALADVPAGTGLGSSGAFTVALLKALHPDMNPRWLAEEASTVEIDRLGRPCGLQDSYVAAYGGVRCFTWAMSGAVTVNTIDVGPLVERLYLFSLGQTRDNTDTLALQGQATENLHVTKHLAVSALTYLKAGRWDDYGALLNDQWENKRKRAPGVTDRRIDLFHQAGLAAGALGGKLVGAGGGGYLLFYTHDPERLRAALMLPELEFGFDTEGASCMS